GFLSRGIRHAERNVPRSHPLVLSQGSPTMLPGLVSSCSLSRLVFYGRLWYLALVCGDIWCSAEALPCVEGGASGICLARDCDSSLWQGSLRRLSYLSLNVSVSSLVWERAAELTGATATPLLFMT
ncbi:unnamed protein product, partial [Ectocarpus sp. 4 AP-2014]